MRIPRLATKRDGRALGTRFGIDHDIGAPRFVGHKYFIRLRREGDAIREFYSTNTRNNFERPIIDDRHLMRSGRRHVHEVCDGTAKTPVARGRSIISVTTFPRSASKTMVRPAFMWFI